MKKLINVLWAIEKDLRIIASNTEVLTEAETIGQDSLKKLQAQIKADS